MSLAAVPISAPQWAPRVSAPGVHTVVTATSANPDGLRVHLVQYEPSGRVVQHDLTLVRSQLLRKAGPPLRFLDATSWPLPEATFVPAPGAESSAPAWYASALPVPEAASDAATAAAAALSEPPATNAPAVVPPVFSGPAGPHPEAQAAAVTCDMKPDIGDEDNPGKGKGKDPQEWQFYELVEIPGKGKGKRPIQRGSNAWYLYSGNSPPTSYRSNTGEQWHGHHAGGGDGPQDLRASSPWRRCRCDCGCQILWAGLSPVPLAADRCSACMAGICCPRAAAPGTFSSSTASAFALPAAPPVVPEPSAAAALPAAPPVVPEPSAAAALPAAPPVAPAPSAAAASTPWAASCWSAWNGSSTSNW